LFTNLSPELLYSKVLGDDSEGSLHCEFHRGLSSSIGCLVEGGSVNVTRFHSLYECEHVELRCWACNPYREDVSFEEYATLLQYEKQ